MLFSRLNAVPAGPPPPTAASLMSCSGYGMGREAVDNETHMVLFARYKSAGGNNIRPYSYDVLNSDYRRTPGEGLAGSYAAA